MRLAALYRYPVKGLSPEPLPGSDLVVDGYFPCDRMFALENGLSGFDAAAPVHQPKIKFLMLMRNASLAALRTRYDDETGVLSIAREGREVARGDLATPEGRGAIERFFTEFAGDALRGPARLLSAPDGFRFTDSKSGFVSLLNLASVAAVASAQGGAVDPLRFRANLHIEGLPAWGEGSLLGRTLAIGEARLEVTKMIDRCAATGVDPQTGARDMDLVQTLRKHFGHIDCGIYARVVRGGWVQAGNAISVA